MPRGVPGSRAPHGTVTRYYGHGCRCDLCREVQRAYYLAHYGADRQRWADYNAAREPAHGTESRYSHRKCRCDECRAAASLARGRRRRVASGSMQSADPGEAVQADREQASC